MNKSSVSRILEKLYSDKYIYFKKNPQDRRQKSYSLLKKGLDYVYAVQESSNQIIKVLFSNFSFEEQLKFAFYVNKIVDYHTISKNSQMPEDHPVTIALARLGKASGMAGNFFLNSQFTGTEYYTLKLIKNDPNASVVSISKKLVRDKSTISRIINSLYSRNILIRISATHALKLSKSGELAVLETNKLGRDFIKAGLSTLDRTSIHEFYNLLDRAVKNNQQQRNAVTIQRTHSIRRLKTLKERKIARGLLMIRLVKEGKQFNTPDRLYSETCEAYGLFSAKDLVAACVRENNTNGTQIRMSCKQAQVSNSLFRAFIEHVAKQTFL